MRQGLQQTPAQSIDGINNTNAPCVPHTGERPYYYHDIHDHYWRSPADDDTDSVQYAPHSTLNGGASAPDKLKYVMLFHDANPRWSTDGIIFVKSNIHLLPGGAEFRRQEPSTNQAADQISSDKDVAIKEAAATVKQTEDDVSQAAATVGQDQDSNNSKDQVDSDDKTDQPASDSLCRRDPPPDDPFTPDLSAYECGPIAVFEQKRGRNGSFRFAGYHKITRLQFLPPHSQELRRLLEQKFSQVSQYGRVQQKRRSKAAWDESMRHRWAVVRLEKDGECDMPAPDIKTKERALPPRAHKEQKSVNELLHEMRLGGDEQSGGEGQTQRVEVDEEESQKHVSEPPEKND